MTPTPEGKQLAADLANAECVLLEETPRNWTPGHCDSGFTVMSALARLATEHLALKAQLEEALADLREIDRLMWAPNWGSRESDRAVATIAAKYRVETDPLVEAIKAANEHQIIGEEAFADILRAELSKRGYEIGGKS